MYKSYAMSSTASSRVALRIASTAAADSTAIKSDAASSACEPLLRITGQDLIAVSEPVVDHQKRRPVARMAVARIGEHFALRLAQRLCTRNVLLAQFGVERFHQIRGGFVVHLPQRGQRAACARPHRDAGESQRGTFVALRRIACAQ